MISMDKAVAEFAGTKITFEAATITNLNSESDNYSTQVEEEVTIGGLNLTEFETKFSERPIKLKKIDGKNLKITRRSKFENKPILLTRAKTLKGKLVIEDPSAQKKEAALAIKFDVDRLDVQMGYGQKPALPDSFVDAKYKSIGIMMNSGYAFFPLRFIQFTMGFV